MFRTADELMEGDPWGSYGGHVLSFHWRGFEPHLVVRDLGGDVVTERGLEDARMYVSRTKRCVGRLVDGEHAPCPWGAEVDRFPQCPRCASPRIPVQTCVFEPLCSGERCPSAICGEPHVVYAAFTGDAVKIGMTLEARLVQRGIEQGADAIAPLRRCGDRREAREWEKRISTRLKRPQAMGAKEFARQVVKPLDRRRIDALHRDILSRLDDDALDEIHLLEGYPMDGRPSTPPRPARVEGRHRGRVIGVRGKYLIFDDNGPRMLSLASLPARFIDLRQR